MQHPISRSVPVLFDSSLVLRIVRETRLAQGLPERITDPMVLDRLAVLIAAASRPAKDDGGRQPK